MFALPVLTARVTRLRSELERGRPLIVSPLICSIAPLAISVLISMFLTRSEPLLRRLLSTAFVITSTDLEAKSDASLASPSGSVTKYLPVLAKSYA